MTMSRQLNLSCVFNDCVKVMDACRLELPECIVNCGEQQKRPTQLQHVGRKIRWAPTSTDLRQLQEEAPVVQLSGEERLAGRDIGVQVDTAGSHFYRPFPLYANASSLRAALLGDHLPQCSTASSIPPFHHG